MSISYYYKNDNNLIMKNLFCGFLFLVYAEGWYYGSILSIYLIDNIEDRY